MKMCVDCGNATNTLTTSIRCNPCFLARYRWQKTVQRQAKTKVQQALKSGRLLPPTLFDCADCGKKAEQYDHRDYTRPLKVEAVCRRCNIKRGPADKWVSKAEAARIAKKHPTWHICPSWYKGATLGLKVAR